MKTFLPIFVSLCLFLGTACGEGEQPPTYDDSLFGAVPGGQSGDSLPNTVSQGPVQGAPANALVLETVLTVSRYAEVRFEVPGLVSEVFVRPGDTVRRGQLLGTLDTGDRRARLDEVTARHRQTMRAVPAGSSYRRNRRPPAYLEADIRARQREVAQAVSGEKGDLKKLRRALQEGGESGAARAAQDIASRRNKKPEMAATRRANKERLARKLGEELEYRIRQLKYDIDASRLVSPLAGVVAGVHVEPGATWTTRSAQPAFEVLDPHSLVAQVSVPAVVAARLEYGARAWLELVGHGPDGKGLPIVGVIEEVLDRADYVVPHNGQLAEVRQVTVRLPRKLPGTVEPGDEVRVAIPR